ncbi:MAG: DNA polymerase III subunit beta [Deltaproteobacteria bacterium]|nr:MAG: DNA polymerase III subunit beta [Deltaproteobacteria bacterium]
MLNIKLNKSSMVEILSKIQGLTGRKSNLAITSHLLIRATGSEISIIATDLETAMEGFYEATVISGGNITINAKKLYEIIRNFPTEEIHIVESENRWFTIGNKTVEYHLVGMDPEDFPLLPDDSGDHKLSVPGYQLKKMIEQMVLIPGIGGDDRPHLTGIKVELLSDEHNQIFRLLSTDGRRLGLTDYTLPEDVENFEVSSYLIPKKGLAEVLKFIETDDTVQIRINESHVVFEKTNETIMIRLLEGDFPKYDALINFDPAYSIEYDKDLLQMMLKRMSILSSETYSGVIFSFSENQIQIVTSNPDMGESREEMLINYNREAFDVAFNPRYFIDALSVIEDDKVMMNIVNGSKPCILYGASDTSFLSVIMPMKF